MTEFKKIQGAKLSKRDCPIEYIVVHYTAGSTSRPGSALKIAQRFNDSSRQASADFVVDDTNIIQYNTNIIHFYSWAVGTPKKGVRCSNKNSISIEMCSTFTGKMDNGTYANDPGWSFTGAVVDNTVELVRRLCKEYGIPKERVIRHFDVSGKKCPGVIGWNPESGSEEKWEEFLSKI